jgi:hypothetical protein|nr:MAG TPA: Exonuclease [Bacteriophage sp.]
MIHDQDRSGYFGASDTKYVMGNWNTKTFDKWWLIKLGLAEGFPPNIYMEAGTYYEHYILDALGIKGLEKDKQIILEDLKLRVNLDGNTDNCIYEVKTYKAGKPFNLKREYYQQVQVQMYASGIHNCKVVAYPLWEDDYLDLDGINVDPNLIELYDVAYDKKFIQKYLLRLETLRGFLVDEMECIL